MFCGQELGVPVTVLTGYLGSGKTTLLNHILRSSRHGMRFAIIENEFGDVGVDEKVIRVTDSTDEEVIEVTNGCVCCTVRRDLVQALKRLHSKVAKFDAVIIETSGLADPGPVAQTFLMDRDIRRMYTLDGICTVVDAKHIAQHLEEEKPEGVENEAVEQIAFADRVLLNKTDLVPDEAELFRIEKKIKAINAHAPILWCQHAAVDPKSVINLRAFCVQRVLELDPEFLQAGEDDHAHDASVSSVSCRFQGEVNVNKLEYFISNLVGDPESAKKLLRYKGVLAARGMDAKYVFQGVHMLFTGGFSGESAKWKPGEPRECRFVFIGKDLDRAALMEGFEKCKAEKELRFRPGDEVLANVGTWRRARILKLWDEGNPYRIELLDKEGAECVWGPVDDDEFVRAADAQEGCMFM